MKEKPTEYAKTNKLVINSPKSITFWRTQIAVAAYMNKKRGKAASGRIVQLQLPIFSRLHIILQFDILICGEYLNRSTPRPSTIVKLVRFFFLFSLALCLRLFRGPTGV